MRKQRSGVLFCVKATRCLCRALTYILLRSHMWLDRFGNRSDAGEVDSSIDMVLVYCYCFPLQLEFREPKAREDLQLDWFIARTFC
jgi:hypothetical protein